jgi:hypothetical protein
MILLTSRTDFIRIGLCLFLTCAVIRQLTSNGGGIDVDSPFGLIGPFMVLLAPHFLLPLLLPRMKGLVLGVALYTVGWLFLWCEFYSEVELLQAKGIEHRGYLTAGLFMFSNIAFALGLCIRLLTMLILRLMRSEKKVFNVA